MKSLKIVVSSGHLLNYTTQSVFLLTIDNTPVANIVCPLLAAKSTVTYMKLLLNLYKKKKYIYINLFLMPKKEEGKMLKNSLI